MDAEAGAPSGVLTNDFGDMNLAAKQYVKSVPKTMPPRAGSGAPGAQEGGPPAIQDSNRYRQRHGLVVWDGSMEHSGVDAATVIPPPYENFHDFEGLSRAQLDCFHHQGFQAPTPIQAQTWPIAMGQRDIVSIAKTGSGKTLAFLLPAYKKMDARSGGRGASGAINALILAPTRELATQIQEESEKFGQAAGYYSAVAYGGAPKKDQLRSIHDRGASILVATPGRLNDFLDSRQVDISSVFYLVLDEADRMLDMGFEPQIRSIIRRLPRRRQTLMFSATWPEEVGVGVRCWGRQFDLQV